MADNANQNDKVAFVKTIGTKYGPMEKVSIELNKIGQVAEKDGKVYLILPQDHKALNKYEKDGQEPRFFLNFVSNTFKSLKLDEYDPEANNNSGGGASSDDGKDDLPF